MVFSVVKILTLRRLQNPLISTWMCSCIIKTSVPPRNVRKPLIFGESSESVRKSSENRQKGRR